MARPYSSLLLAGDLTNTSLSVTVPAGEVWVVRDMSIVYDGNATDGDLFYVTDDTTGTWLWRRKQLADDEWAQWQGREVLPEGTILTAHASGLSDVIFRISGYRLRSS